MPAFRIILGLMVKVGGQMASSGLPLPFAWANEKHTACPDFLDAI